MEKKIYFLDDNQLQIINSIEFDNEYDLQEVLEKMIKLESRFLNHKIIAYKRELPTNANSGRPDFVLINSEGEIIIIECKLTKNAQSRRKVVSQLLDYTANIPNINNFAGWQVLIENIDNVEIVQNNPNLYIVCDKIDNSLHNLVEFLVSKNIEINLITTNKFLINSLTYYTLTPHLSPQEKSENYNAIEAFLNSVNRINQSQISDLINVVVRNKPIAVVKKQKTKRLSIHILGISEKFPIWLSQNEVRNIACDNISIPKSSFCPCSINSYNDIIIEVKIILGNNLIEYQHDDVAFYIDVNKINLEDFENLIKQIKTKLN